MINIDNNKLRINKLVNDSKVLDIMVNRPIRVNVEDKSNNKNYVIADLLPATSSIPTIIGCRVDKERDLLETIIIDGPLNDNETFDSRVKKIIRNDLLMIKSKSNLNSRTNIIELGEAKANFDYKLYVVDLICKKNNKLVICRQIKAFFLESKCNEVYQVTIRSKMFDYPTSEFTIGKFNRNGGYDRDLMSILTSVLGSISYKK